MDIAGNCLGVLKTTALSVVAYQLVTKFFPWLYMNIIGPRLFGPRVDVSRLGKWAVITGGTDGIGKSYAKALAKKGLNVVLISRSLSKLETAAQEIADAYNVETKIIDVDFTGGQDIYSKIQQNIEGLEIGVLVNNVGMSYSYPEFFVEYFQKKPQALRDIITVNVHSVLQMTALILPQMVERKKGAIINISSTTATVPNPLLTVYSSSKAFIDKFSADLQTEYRAQGIVIQNIQPGFVATNMSKMRKATVFAPSADTYVESAFKTLGLAECTAGYLPHILMQTGIHLLSSIFCEQFAGQVVFKQYLKLRERALRNIAKKQ